MGIGYGENGEAGGAVYTQFLGYIAAVSRYGMYRQAEPVGRSEFISART